MPMEETEANMALFEKAKIAARRSGLSFPISLWAAAAMETRCLLWVSRPLTDLGAAGDGAHSANEYILIDQYIPRIAMLASFVLTI